MSATAEQPVFEAAIDKTTASLREFNELVLGELKKAGNVTVDAYEASWRAYADYAETLAAATPADVAGVAATAHAKATRDLTSAYSKAARSLFS
jgi:hypothetical protein